MATFTNQAKNTASYSRLSFGGRDKLLLETGDNLLLETGDKFLLETSSTITFTNQAKNTASYTNQTKN